MSLTNPAMEATGTRYRPGGTSETVHGTFDHIARAMPDRIAIVGDEGYLRYSTLAATAQAVAAALRRRGIVPGDRVGLLALRSPQTVAAMLGILRCGAAYLPFHWSNPTAAQRRICLDAAPKLMLLQEPLCLSTTRFWEGEALVLESICTEQHSSSAPPPSVLADSTACLLYANGPAGVPLGAPVSHASLLRFALECTYADLGPAEIVLQLADLTTDISAFEIWGALLNGGQLAVPGALEPSLDQIGTAVRRHGVTTLWLPPRLAAQAGEPSLQRMAPLRQLISGGDVLAPVQVQKSLSATVGAAPSQAEPATSSSSEFESEAPLVEGQSEVWLASQFGDAASCVFNEIVSLDFDGEVDVTALQQALERLLARHDALRACFTAGGEAMRVRSPWRLVLDMDDFSTCPDQYLDATLSGVLRNEARLAFDLPRGPLLRARFLRLRSRRHVLVLCVHRIVCDGWALNTLISELIEIYAANCAGRPLRLPQAPSFAAYARAQTHTAAMTALETESYWRGQLGNPQAPQSLPTDNPRPQVRGLRSAQCRRRIDSGLRDAILALGTRHDADLFAVLLSAWQALIGRLCGNDEAVVCAPITGRPGVEDGALVGQCQNFLPLHSRWDAGTSIGAHIAAVSHSIAEACGHRRCRVSALTRQLPLPRPAGDAQVLFRLECLPAVQTLPGVIVQTARAPRVHLNADLCLVAVETEQGLGFDCEYDTDLFAESTIERWLDSYLLLLQAFIDDDAGLLVRAPLLSIAERERLLVTLNDTGADYPRELCLQQLFENQACLWPDAIAVSYGAAQLRYAELEAQANRLANHLLARMPPAAHSAAETGQRLAAVMVRRSNDMVVALLACLKAGFAYVPLDPSHPPARLRQVLEQARPALLVTDEVRGFVPAAEDMLQVHLVDERADIAAASDARPEVATDPDGMAYVIFTSGSSGVPKGVEIGHHAIVNLLYAMANEPGFSADDVMLATTTISFDIAALELFLPLSVGGRVVIAGRREAANGDALRRRLERSGATVLQGTPSTWKLLLEAGFRGDSLWRMLCGGEVLPRDLARRLLSCGGELWNMYGPTETTVWSSCARVSGGDEPISIGTRPIANTRFYVLDRHDQPVPAGVPGQLHIGGDGVARGYLGQPERTAAAFVTDPFTGGRMYRTGDLARRLPGGELQLLGRMDRQLKLRGFRIEPDEIESALMKDHRVSAVAVECRPDPAGVPRLAAFYVESRTQPREPMALRALLAGELPEYMIPSAWVRLDSLPLTANGKIDRQALPQLPNCGDLQDRTAPRDDDEAALAAIWAEVLKQEPIGIHADLFDLGADSIQLFQIVGRARRRGLQQLSVRMLMQLRTIARVVAATRGHSECDQANRAASIDQASRELAIGD